MAHKAHGAHEHGCDHGPGTARRLGWSAAIFGLSAVLQGLGGFWTGSLGLISDSLENLNDLIVNLVGLTSLMVANRREPCDRFAYGWHRLEVFNTLFGAGMLLVLAGAVTVEAIHRLQHPQAIQTGWVLLFSLGGLGLNIAATLVLRPKHEATLERDANLKSAYTHAFSDALTSIGLVLSMLVIRFTGWTWVDPAIALVIVVVILRGAFSLGRDAFGILMHRAAFDHEFARQRLLTLPGVLAVEDLRSWRVCSHLVVATAHIAVNVDRLDETSRLLGNIEELLAEEFDVRHLTVHFETADMAQQHQHRFNHRHEAEEHHH
ncbi:MAG: cation transporter [Holophaga sp.]|nr:cation transporter [Holophaga sp.]